VSSRFDALDDAVAIRPPSDAPPIGEYLAVTYRHTTHDIRADKAKDFLGALSKVDAKPWIRKAAKEEGLTTVNAPAKLSSLMRYLTARPFELVTEQPWASPYLAMILDSHPRTRFLIGWTAIPPAQDEAYAVLLAQPRDDAGTAARALIAAIAADDVSRALTLIAPARNEIDATDGDGATALHHAVAARSVELVEALLAAGANPNAFAVYGNAPLFAARHERGVGPFATSIEGGRHSDVLRRLGDAGADSTAVAGTFNIISLLDATPVAPDSWLDYWLAKGAKPLALTGLHPLGNALTGVQHTPDPNTIPRDAKAFRTLLRAGADPNERTKDGTVFHTLLGETVGFPDPTYPARVELLPMVRAMVEAGAREEPNREGAYPGDFAIGWGYDEIVPLLSRFSAHGLRRASRKGFQTSVERLLAQGIDPNAPDPISLQTALHTAAEGGRFEIARLLLAAGADPERRDRKNRTPRDLAIAAGHAEVAASLELT
jgi:ankyrin repeat protein